MGLGSAEAGWWRLDTAEDSSGEDETGCSVSPAPHTGQGPGHQHTASSSNTTTATVSPPPASAGAVIELETKVHPKFGITEKAPTRAFSWLKAATTAFTFKTL